jgi:hypothetical protein
MLFLRLPPHSFLIFQHTLSLCLRCPDWFVFLLLRLINNDHTVELFTTTTAERAHLRTETAQIASFIAQCYDENHNEECDWEEREHKTLAEWVLSYGLGDAYW